MMNLCSPSSTPERTATYLVRYTRFDISRQPLITVHTASHKIISFDLSLCDVMIVT